MTDSMKFGPEWLRNLSSEGSSISSGGSRYYLAEHRYGREEMLALFEQSLKLRPPASMMSFTSLYVDQVLNPLALAPMTEEENRLWSGRGVPPGAPRGRGGSMDRGRGRGRGGTFHPGFTRSNSSYDDSVRPFERNQNERGWSERNGDIGDWGVSSSPRKEYGNSRGGLNSTDNWRRHRIDDMDVDGWRATNHRSSGLQDKWNTGSGRNISSNWRDGDTRGDEHSHLSDRQANNRVSWHSSGDSRNSSQRRIFDIDDHLPEWATENPSESGGTFDASGAFHGSDDEYLPEKDSQPIKSNNNNNNNKNNNSNTIHKSASQQNIPPTKKLAPLSTSQSATNLVKKTDESNNKESSKERQKPEEKQSCVQQENDKHKEDKNNHNQQQQQIENKKEKVENNISKQMEPNSIIKQELIITNIKKVDDEFDHMKEVTDDIVNKLILDDEIPKQNELHQQIQQRSGVAGAGVSQLPYPAGLMPPPSSSSQDKWYYRDPQGEVQGPFSSQEMADWFRAGYFTVSLLVRRQCDERYFTLGDLIKQCPGVPFLTCCLPPLKNDPVSIGLGKVPPGVSDISDPLQLQQLHMQRLLQRHAEAIRTLSQTEPWGALSHLQQRELVTQHVMSQPQVLSELPAFVPHIANTQINNPLVHMISQMQQANKLPIQPTVLEKPPNSISTQHLDPLQQLVQQMGGMQTPAPTPTEPAPQQTEDPIKSLLRQLANQPTQRDIWDLRASQTSFPSQQPQQWQQPPAIPHSMWDLHNQSAPPVIPPPIVTPNSLEMHHSTQSSTSNQPSTPIINENAIKEQEKEEQKKKAEMEREQKQKERKEAAERERKKKEQEQLEKIKAQKEAEEKRKEEQRRRDAEKKAEAEKQRKEEERVRKELEKAKREAEEKKARELEEKRRLKEQKKAEEEARRKQEEERKKEEEEKQRKEAERREEQTRRQTEALRRMQEQQQQQQQRSKAAPWCQTTPEPNNLSLADIQRAEREKRAEQAALLQQQRALNAAKESQEQQTVADKSAIQLKWATKKPTAPKKIKSLAEIQAEEQERVAKQAAEARLIQQQKEKEAAAVPSSNTYASIWSTASQSLTWASSTHTTAGFWDETPTVQKTVAKPAAKNIPTNVVSSNTQQQQQQQNTNKANGKTNKTRAKKEEQQVMKLFDKNNANNDEFTAWCTKTLSTLNSDVDIPTFIGFLRDIESPYEVKDYVRQYLGDSSQALHFANQFVERRSRVKEQQRAALQHKDDLCQPAPAINPSSEFQEVKGKGKKTKKSKMTKVDARILGFSVTAAEDRINVGDRDYGDNI